MVNTDISVIGFYRNIGNIGGYFYKNIGYENFSYFNYIDYEK